MKIKIGSRGSFLALIQAKEVIQKIKEKFPEIEIELLIIKTTGDKDLGQFETLPAIGVFVKEIEDALLKDKIDIAVHSLKDLPTEIPNGLVFGAALKRANYQDILISKKYSWGDLPEKAVIGTGSLRRRIQLLNFCPNIAFNNLRGNIDTRIKKLTAKNMDAIICAHAALLRLNILDDRCFIVDEKYIDYKFTPFVKEIMLPAVGQGIIGIEYNKKNKNCTQIEKILAVINHTKTFQEACIERQFLAELGGGCLVPAGALAEIKGNFIELEGFHAEKDGSNYKREKLIYPLEQMNEIGQDLANKIKMTNESRNDK